MAAAVSADPNTALRGAHARGTRVDHTELPSPVLAVASLLAFSLGALAPCQYAPSRPRPAGTATVVPASPAMRKARGSARASRRPWRMSRSGARPLDAQRPDSAGSDQTTTRAWNVPPAKNSNHAIVPGPARAPGRGDSSGAAVPGLAQATAAAGTSGSRGGRRRRVCRLAGLGVASPIGTSRSCTAGSRLRLLWTSVVPCARSQPRWHMTAHPCQQVLSVVGDERNAQLRRASPAPPHRSQRRSGDRIASRGAWPCCGAAAMPCARRAVRPCPATLVIPGLSRRDAAQPRGIPPTGLTMLPR